MQPVAIFFAKTAEDAGESKTRRFESAGYEWMEQSSHRSLLKVRSMSTLPPRKKKRAESLNFESGANGQRQ